MGHAPGEDLDRSQVQAFLASRFDPASRQVAHVGAGAWSRCFGFHRGEQELVVRFGQHVDDFRKDRLAAAFRTPELPIPTVLAIGEAFDGFYAVSTRVRGIPLESVSEAQWRSLVPALADALEAMRLADVSATAGFGGWDGAGRAAHTRWSEHLLSVSNDTPQQRTYGWRARLASFHQGEEAWEWGVERLRRVASDVVPRCLIHGDLINRNVLVDGAAISGVFDWGCACYGDHLYDLAWFEFWEPWSPKLDTRALRSELERRWHHAGYAPHNYEERLMACHLHIGLDHLAYNAHLGDWATLAATADRMRALAGGGGRS